MVHFPDDVVFFDIETHSITEMYAMPAQDYYRLGGYAYGEGPVKLVESFSELYAILKTARTIVAHNGHQFDFSVMLGDEALPLSRRNHQFDTLIHATLAMPAPEGVYTRRDGKLARSTGVQEYRRWYGLDNLAFQLGVPGKSQDFNKVAEEFEYDLVPILGPDGEPVRFKSGQFKDEIKTTRVRREDRCCGWGNVPLDHAEYREYLEQDVVCLREVARGLLDRMPLDRYAQREQIKAGIDAQISRNGWRVDQDAAHARIKEMDEVTAYGLQELHDLYGMPVHGKKPLSSKPGKEAVLAALSQFGIRPDDLDKTATGAPSLGADSIQAACGTAAKGLRYDGKTVLADACVAFGDLVATLAGQRTLAELALASLHSDGRVHPSIWPGQRSGRKSTTKPGLTIWDDRDKHYFLPDSDDHVLIEIDASNADARAVAAMSGDLAFAERFKPGADGHLINAWAVWGKDVVGTDKHDPKTAEYRQTAKVGGHAWSYRVGALKLSMTLGLSLPAARKFIAGLNTAFRGVVAWQNAVVAAAQRDGYVVNDWSRKMPITGRAYTQAPAFLGQSVTNEILADGLIALPDRIIRMIKATIHDAAALSMPKATLDRDLPFVVRCLSTRWKPTGSGTQEIEFPFEHGPPGRNWKEALH